MPRWSVLLKLIQRFMFYAQPFSYGSRDILLGFTGCTVNPIAQALVQVSIENDPKPCRIGLATIHIITMNEVLYHSIRLKENSIISITKRKSTRKTLHFAASQCSYYLGVYNERDLSRSKVIKAKLSIMAVPTLSFTSTLHFCVSASFNTRTT